MVQMKISLLYGDLLKSKTSQLKKKDFCIFTLPGEDFCVLSSFFLFASGHVLMSLFLVFTTIIGSLPLRALKL